MVVIAYSSASFPMFSVDKWKRTRVKEKASVERLDEIDGEAGRLLTKSRPAMSLLLLTFCLSLSLSLA